MKKKKKKDVNKKSPFRSGCRPGEPKVAKGFYVPLELWADFQNNVRDAGEKFYSPIAAKALGIFLDTGKIPNAVPEGTKCQRIKIMLPIGIAHRLTTVGDQERLPYSWFVSHAIENYLGVSNE